ncbi:DUF1700 domain-containing protein [Paenibacillus whitsoniae]|uniref:DUF1700 domain-containing protein n=1 Tax=Paenibacillus whitsoniae TaxID=2496558 RepID=A0A3S0C7R6_9BACL|nr:DUF1700 domain-containing protein [Paenibacillus whitsoniae]RTE07955.1 DUF1700 domain-containing protein [Paenibacillus whitsoniae]
MSKADYFKELNYRLRGLPDKERQNILAVYEELFQKALENGKQESDVAQSLGYPRVPNWDGAKQNPKPQQAETPQTQTSEAAPNPGFAPSEAGEQQQVPVYEETFTAPKPEPARQPMTEELPYVNRDLPPQAARSWEPPPYTPPYAPDHESANRPPFPPYTPPNYPYPAKQDSSIKAIIISIMLGFFNLIFVVGPWFGLCATLIALFVSGFALIIAPIVGALTSMGSASGNDLTFILFAMLACFGLGVILTSISSWLIKLFFKLSWKYIQFNAKLIKGA